MKKSFIALFISSVLVLSACEDSHLSQKVFDAEKKIVQLESDFNRVTKELAAKEDEITRLKSANDSPKAEQGIIQQTVSNIPALQVDIETLYKKSEKLKFAKDPTDEFWREESEVSLNVEIPVTKIDWLDKLLLQQAYQQLFNEEDKIKWLLDKLFLEQTYQQLPNEETKEKNLPEHITQALLTSLVDQQFQSNIEAAKEEKPIGYDHSLSANYLGQRNHIATFSYTYHQYTGGAHGMFNTQYINIDGNKKAIIHLNDLVPLENQTQLGDILWDTYKNSELGPYSDDWIDQEKFRIPDNFYFNGDKIVFVYDVYELGPFAAGNVELTVERYEVNKLLNPDYQYNLKYDDDIF